MTDDLFRVYLDPDEIGSDGYPYAWHGTTRRVRMNDLPSGHDEYLYADMLVGPAIKDLVRDQTGHRCGRCGHPYRKGEHGNGEWSPCDECCSHGGPVRIIRSTNGERLGTFPERDGLEVARLAWPDEEAQAQWRILTVHHLNGIKHDCRWWNLVPLCQRCHLTIQGKVRLARPWQREHSDWFKPYVAAFYASTFLGEELSRDETMARLDELLDLQLREPSLF